MRRLAAILALILGPGAAGAVTCQETLFEGHAFTLCEVAAGEDLRLFSSGPEGPFAGFSGLAAHLAGQGLGLAFAMNAGMYDEALAPIGLHIEEGVEIHRIVTREGPGNFGLLPNGVFCMTRAGDGGPTFQIIESRAFADDPPACWLATQSGPLLVIDGALHPAFRAGSESVNYRNGVGVADDGSRAVFAIADDAVNFDTFARFFRDGLGIADALFLDGSVSRLHAPDLGRSDPGFPIGPILGVVVPAPGAGG